MGNRHSNVYCGNNGANTNGKPIGTKNECLRVGIGKGLHLPCNPSYSGEYDPIDDRRTYCGNNEDLPDDYDIMGSASMCLKKGIGLGMARRAEGGCGLRVKIIWIIIWFLLSIVGFLLVYILRPGFVLEDDDEDNKKLNVRKLVIYTSSYVIILALILFILSRFI